MTRRRRILAIVAVALLLALAGSVQWLAQPEQFTGLLLDRIGVALGLEITAGDTSEYRLRGTPQLVLRELVVRQPGEPTPILRAARAELLVPWSTLRARGEELTIERIEFDGPHLDITALQRWLATRPKTDAPARIPDLTRGISIRDGRIDAAGWRVDTLAASVPALHPGSPVRARANGRVLVGSTRMPFDLALALTSPDAAAGLGAHGAFAIETAGWQLPMQVRLRGRLNSDAGGIGLDAMRLGATARYVSGTQSHTFALGVAGPLRIQDGEVSIAPVGIAIRGRELIPSLRAHGRVHWHDALGLDLSGALARWPPDWPALPAPIGRPATAVPLELRYAGPLDFSGETELNVEPDAMRADLRFRLPDVLDWFDAMESGTPLPPLVGRVTAPRLELAGAVLDGVEIDFEDRPAPRAAP